MSADSTCIPLRHFNISLEHLPYQNSTWFYKSWPIITPIFFIQQLSEGKIELDGGCTWKINLASYTHLWTAGSQVLWGTPGLPVWYIQHTAATLFKQFNSICLWPVNMPTWNRLCTFNWTWQNIHSLQLYIIWCQTMEQIPTVYIYIYKKKLCIYKRLFPILINPGS